MRATAAPAFSSGCAVSPISSSRRSIGSSASANVKSKNANPRWAAVKNPISARQVTNAALSIPASESQRAI